MPAFGKWKNFNWPAGLARNRLHLRHGSVLIVDTLDGKNRASNARKIFFDIPSPEVGMEPDVIPSPERARRIAMVTAEFLGQICGFKSCLGLSDARNAQFLHENMGSKQHQAAHPVMRPRVDEGDGPTVAVADLNWVLDLQCGEKIRQRAKPLVVHVAHSPRLGEHIGIAAAVGEHVVYAVPLEEMHDYAHRIQDVRAGAVSDFASRAFIPETFVVLVGDASKFADELTRDHGEIETVSFEALDLGSPTLTH